MSSNNALKKLQKDLRNCRKCVSRGFPVSPNPIFSGPMRARVMLFGQAPGTRNDEEEYPFNGGRSGQVLFEWLKVAGWDEVEFRSNHYIASVTRCYPGKNKSGTGDRVPSAPEQKLCMEWLRKELGLLNIKLIIPMGKLSIEQFLGKGKKLADVIGKAYEVDGRIIIPIPHPSGASTWLNHEEHKQLLHKAISELRKARKSHDL